MTTKVIKFVQRALTLLIVLGLCSVLGVVFYAMRYHGYRVLSVQSGSMSPAIKIGDGLIVKSVPFQSLRVGDVVTYRQGGGLISHRIVSIKKQPNVLITKGDYNRVADDPFPADMVTGRAVAIVPHLGKVTTILKSPLALLLIIYIPSVGIILWEARSLQRALVRPYRVSGRNTR